MCRMPIILNANRPGRNRVETHVTKAVEANPFWDYSVHHYATPGVAGICLSLQDRAGLSVNFLLYCIWLAHRGRALNFALLAQNEPLQQCHNQVLAPLRQARHGMRNIGMKMGQPKLYLQLKQAELAVERVEQKLLYRLAANMSESQTTERQLAQANLDHYFSACQVPLSDWSEEVGRLLDLILGDESTNVFFISGKSTPATKE